MTHRNTSNELYEKIPHGTANFPFKIHETTLNHGFYLYPHLHQEFELLIMQEGDGILYIDNEKYILSKGDGLFINSRCIHFGEKLTEEKTSFYAIVFSEKIFGPNLNDIIIEKYVTPIINNTRKLPILFKGDSLWQSELLDIANALYSFKDSTTWCNELIVKTHLFKLWTVLCEHSTSLESGTINKHLDDIKLILEYIDMNYATKLTLNKLAGQCHMSPEHFCRVFSCIMHKSPISYLMEVRIEKSCHILSSSSLPISDIAITCGFSDFSYYSKCFKERMGCSPSEYRKHVNHCLHNH